MRRRTQVAAAVAAGMIVTTGAGVWVLTAPGPSLSGLANHHVEAPEVIAAAATAGQFSCPDPLPAPVLAAQIGELTDFDPAALTRVSGAASESVQEAVLRIASTDCALLRAATADIESGAVVGDPIEVMLSMTRCGVQGVRDAGGVCPETTGWVRMVTDAARTTYTDRVRVYPI